MQTCESHGRLMLLDEWHVDLVSADIEEASVERVRSRVNVSIREWAVGGRSSGWPRILLRVEQ